MKKEDKKFLIKSLVVLAMVLTLFVIVSLNHINNEELLIGGDRDEHGCIGSAGYSWNASEQECVREWETGSERYQVTNFQTCIDAGYPIMESYPRQCRTLGERLFVEKIN